VSNNDFDDNIALMNAVISCNSTVVEELLSRGVNPNSFYSYEHEFPFSVPSSTFSDERGSPFLTACMAGYDEIVDIFIKYGADVNLAVSNNVSPIKQAIAGCFDPFGSAAITDFNSETTIDNYLRTIKLLIRSGAHLNNCFDIEGSRPLPYAIDRYFDGMKFYSNIPSILIKPLDTRVIEMLIEYGASTKEINTLIGVRYTKESKDVNHHLEAKTQKEYYSDMITLIHATHRLCLHCERPLPKKWLFFSSKKCDFCDYRG